jgi:hypothetical protein
MSPFVAGLALAAGDPSSQVSRNGYGVAVSWPAMPVAYELDPSNEAGLDEDGVVSAVAAASGAWTAARGADLLLSFSGTVEGLEAGFDERNSVLFTQDWPFSTDVLALTDTWSDQDGEIHDFDIRVNTRDWTWALDGDADRADLQNSLAHEFGHAIGVAHNPETAEATMFATTQDGETQKRDLDPSDEAVAAYLYPGEAEDTGMQPMPSMALCAVGSRLAAGACGLAAALSLSRRRSA